MQGTNIAEQGHVVNVLPPVDINGGAVGDRFKMNNHGHASVIVQIGACYFDRFTGEIGEKFFEKIDLLSCVDAGFEMDVPTILWWMQQDETARQGIMDGDSFFVSPVLIDLKHFLRDIETIWSHATFDFVILTNDWLWQADWYGN